MSAYSKERLKIFLASQLLILNQINTEVTRLTSLCQKLIDKDMPPAELELWRTVIQAYMAKTRFDYDTQSRLNDALDAAIRTLKESKP